MPAEIHKQILDYQGGDANVALELVEKFKPLIKRYAFFLHREDSFEDLQCFLLSMLKTWDTSRLSSTDDATVTRYIANSVKNEYIALSKQKAKERGTSYLEDATLADIHIAALCTAYGTMVLLFSTAADAAGYGAYRHLAIVVFAFQQRCNRVSILIVGIVVAVRRRLAVRFGIFSTLK